MIQLKSGLFLGLAFVYSMMERVLVASARVHQRQYDCGAQIVVTKVVSVEPVYINTYVHENMTFAVNDHFSVTITDAPTSLDEVLTGSTTKLITNTRGGYSNAMYTSQTLHFMVFTDFHSSSPQFSYVNSYSFALMFVPQAQVKHRNRRQSGGNFYLGQGQAVNSCSAAVIYTLINGQLFANTSSGTTQFGMSPGASYANFTPSANPGNITSVFSVDSVNNLMWNNVAFYNNFARFCVMPDQTIVAVFVSPDQGPVGCVFISLSMVRCMHFPFLPLVELNKR
jgi:hypothetical protein